MKVGKAIYNILSRALPVQQNIGFSTDTFAPSGEELITNGNFSATGSELNTLPSPNGAAGSHYRFEPYSPSTVVYAGSNVTEIKAFAGAEGAYHYFRDDFNLNGGAATLVVGKSYKVDITCKVNSGDFDMLFASDLGNVFIQNINNTTYTTITTFVVCSGLSNHYVKIQGLTSGQVVFINDVSIKELGEGWTVEQNWIFQNNGAIVTPNNTTSFIYQNFQFIIGKTYKIKYKIVQNSLSGGTFLALSSQGAFGSKTLTTNLGDNFVYLQATKTSVKALRFFSSGQSGSITITNISVQEMVLTKIFPEIAPPDIDPPYIVYSVVSNQPSNTKNENGEIDEASLEVYSFQDTYNKTVDLGVAVRASLDRVNGTFATVKVDSINYTNEQMDVNESRKLWAAIQDYTVRIKNI